MPRSRFGRIALPTLIVLSAAAPCASAQSGALDTSFGGTGFVTTTMNPWGIIHDVVVQPSTNKIVAAGFDRMNHPSLNRQWAFIRYNPDGSLDTTFGSGGKVVLFGAGPTDVVNDIAVDGSERIVAAGWARTGSNYAFTVVRMNAADGSLDSSFGSGGIVQTRIATGKKDHDYSYALALDPTTGRIVVGGSTTGASSNKSRRVAILRYNTNGSLDTSFDGDGIRIDDWTTDHDAIVRGGLAVQSDSKIVACRDVFGGVPNDWRVARYNANGSNDNGFGSSGKINPTFSGETSTRTWGVAIQTDGKIVISGRGLSTSGGFFHALVSRHDSDGALDASFDGDGWTVTTNSVENQGHHCALQGDGKILVAGFYDTGTSDGFDFVVTRFNANGSLDTTFDGDGQSQLAGIPGSTDSADVVAVDANGNIVAGGWSGTSTTPSFALARYLQ